jgi:large subunit ribosomal protein L29
MKHTEITALSISDLKEKLLSEKEALRKLKFAHQVSSIENPMKMKASRKLIAQLNTELRAKEIQK